MNILYCGDSRVADGALLSARSVAKQVSEPLSIYVLTAGLSYRDKVYTPLGEDFTAMMQASLREFNPDSRVYLFDLSDRFSEALPEANMSTRFTPLCMLRLFADSVEGLPDRLLYLDCDVVCRADPSEMYYADLEGAELGGVADRYGRHFFGDGITRSIYLNSGVLLLDMKLIRQTGLFRRAAQMCRTKRMFMPDQSALNKLAKKKKLFPRKYNEQYREREDTVFRHFTTTLHLLPKPHSRTVKPWDRGRMHMLLGNFEYDTLLDECETAKELYFDSEHTENKTKKL